MAARAMILAPWLGAVSLGAVWLLVATAAAALAEPRFPPGSGVGLDPPPGMSLATDFQGFQRGLASIVIIELPAAAYAQIGIDRRRVAAKVEGAKFEDVTVNGLRGFIVRGRQTAKSRTYRKWAVVLDSPQETALVTAQVPLDDAGVSDADIERALHSIVIGKRGSVEDKVAALPFKVGDPAGFRRSGEPLMGATLGFTEGPKDIDPDDIQPHVVVGTGLQHPPSTTDRGAFAEAILRGTTALKSAKVKSTKLFEVDGTQWAEVAATAEKGPRRTAVDVVVFVRFDADDFIAIVGVAPLGTAYADRFRRLALSVRPVR